MSWCRFLLIFASLQIGSFAFSQDVQPSKYPQGYFRNPLGIPIQLSGNFGELRNNHFHMGLDIRTAQRENLPVYAAAAGYVSRIKIEQYGYGRAVYITHPNGYTTLYAHLNDFYPALNNEVVAAQYRTEKWEQDISFPPGKFEVSKGQLIAYSGNTGGSGGPHLHFEIRETYTENNLNPLLFGFAIPDRVPPMIYRLYMYDRRFSTYQHAPVQVPIKGASGNYTSRDGVVTVNTPRLSFGISAEDKTNSSFSFGIYQAEIFMDDVLQTAFTMNNFRYPDSRYINAAIDFSARARNSTYIQHLSRLPGNKSPIFSNTESDGIITLNDEQPHNILIKVKDAAGNTTNLRYKVRLNAAAVKDYMSIANWVPFSPGVPNQWASDNIEAQFGPQAFYDTVPFLHQAQTATDQLTVSQVHQLHNFAVPVHDSFLIRIKAEKPLTGFTRDKVLMHLVSNRKKVAIKGTWNGDWMEARLRDLGVVSLRIDTIPPRVVPVGWSSGANMSSKPTLTIMADDDVSDLRSFRAEVDGQWLMFSRKNDLFIHRFDGRVSAGRHQLKITAIDEVGNVTEKTYSFTR